MLLNPYRFSAAVIERVRWNPLDKSPNITLSNLDLTAACAAAVNSLVRASTPRSSGKWYFEVLASQVHTAGTLNYIVGLCDQIQSTANYVGATGGSLGWRRNGGYLYSGNSIAAPGFVSGDVLRVAVDFATRSVWFGKNGIWNNGDPSVGGEPSRTFASIPSELYPALSFNSATAQSATGRFKLSEFSNPPPTGFMPWES